MFASAIASPAFALERGGLASSSVSTRVPPGGRSSIPRRAAFATRASGGDEKAKGKDKAKKKETLKAAPPQPKAPLGAKTDLLGHCGL